METHHIRYNSKFIYAEDYKLWADIVLAGGKLSNLPQVLYYYRTHDRQISTVFNAEMCDCSSVIRKDIIRYLLGRDREKYSEFIPVCDGLYDLYMREIISVGEYAEIASRLICK